MKINEISPKELLSTVGSAAQKLGKKVRGIPPAIKEMLPRLKEISAEETRDTIAMWDIYWRWTDATDEEKKFANNQIKNLLKTAGLAGIVVLPGTPLILPMIVKLARKAGVDILPKWADGGRNEIK